MIAYLPYRQNPLDILSNLLHEPLPFLLDSKNFGHQDEQKRYDIIGARPKYQIVIFSDHFVVVQDQKATKHQLKQLDEFIATANATIKDTHLPFSGGFIGYFSYDYTASPYKDLHLLPKQTDLPSNHLAFYSEVFVIDHKKQETLHICQHSKFSLNREFKPYVAPSTVSCNFALAKQKQYANSFNYIKKCIQAGELYQTNLSVCFKGATKNTPLDLYAAQRQSNPGSYSGFLDLGKHQILCHSPESFIQIHNNTITTKPIKGTAKPYDLKLLQSSKNIAENLMIVDLMRNDLAKHCQADSVIVNKFCEVIHLPNLMHLQSEITAKLKPGTSYLNLLKQLSPGGSITGAPKQQSIRLSEFVEMDQREVFCGNLFYLNKHTLSANIMIRTMVHYDHNLLLWGGGGITNLSKLEEEFLEIQIKLSNLLTVKV